MKMVMTMMLELTELIQKGVSRDVYKRQHFYPLKLKGQISQSDYYDMRNSWNFYRKQAYAEAMSPGPDEIESIKNTWHKLYPEMNDHDTFFSTSGEEQILYNQDSALRLI